MKLSSKIRIHFLTLVFFFISFLTGYAKYLFFVFLIVFIHEMGHVLFAKIFKRKISKIEILPFGGLTKIDSLISTNIYEDLLIAAGGIFVQLLFGLYLHWMNEHFTISASTYEFLKNFNITIMAFNMLPICPLDGYKMLKLASEIFIPFKISFTTSVAVSFMVIGVLAVLKVSLIKNNIFIFVFLVYMTIEEIKNVKYIMNRFYLERVNHDFKYKRIDISNYKNMYKNRINYINGKHERKVLFKLFDKNEY